MRFSIIVCTLNRTLELERFLTSLKAQAFHDFELILVDQNDDDRLSEMIAAFRKYFTINHIKISQKGLSHARNVGMKEVQGDIAGFPDDDCWYPEDLLEKIDCFFRENPSYSVVSGCLLDSHGTASCNPRFSLKPQALEKGSSFKAISCALFFKKSSLLPDMYFDESMGVGSGTLWGAGEETDFLLRVMERQNRVFYDPSLFAYHEQAVDMDKIDLNSARRALLYGAGIGRVLRKHKFPLRTIVYECFRSLCGMMISLAFFRGKRAYYYYSAFKGKYTGYFHSS